MPDVVHVKISNANTFIAYTINKISRSKKIPNEFDVATINKKPQEYIDRVLGYFDFDDELLHKLDQLETKQWSNDWQVPKVEILVGSILHILAIEEPQGRWHLEGTACIFS
jgi:hypothetical protein